jgi:hypothetical protein
MNDFLAKDARHFRVTLIVSFALAVAIAITLIVLAVQYAEKYANDVKQTVYDASTSQTKISNTTTLAQQLAKRQDSVTHVEKIVADSKSYAYQDLIINDLRAMASKAGVKILSFIFSDQPTVTNGKPAPKPAGSLHTKTVSVTLDNPVNYVSFLNFLHYIELNNTKMQISNVTISAVTNDKSPSADINSEVLEIEVYVK